MRYLYLFIVLLALAFTSCKKKDVDMGPNYWDGVRTSNGGGIGMIGNTNNLADSFLTKLNSNKIIHIGSLAELDTLDLIVGGNTIYGTSDSVISYYQNTDFNDYKIFVLNFEYYSLDYAGQSSPHLAIDNASQEIRFTCNAGTSGAGSGMTHFSNLYFFKVPISQSNYTISGAITVSESGMWSADGYTATYSQ